MPDAASPALKRWPWWLRALAWYNGAGGVLFVAALFADTPGEQMCYALVLGPPAWLAYRRVRRQMIAASFHPAAPAPLALPESARRYRRHLVPFALFCPGVMPLMLWAKGAWAPPLELGIFFATILYMLWPVLRARVQYSFLLLALGLNLAITSLTILLFLGAFRLFGDIAK